MYRIRKILVGGAAVLFSAAVMGNPVLDNVASGNVSIQQAPGVETIHQSSHNAILDWQSFNINKGQATHFIQPTGGIALNHINPMLGPAQIYGELTATGRIILVNPAGIYFGPSAYVNVGGMIATTANIKNSDFLSGNYQFLNNSGMEGSIINEGTLIAASHGLVALVGSDVTNNGLIKADLGNVVLASGDAYTMSFDGNDLINFAITQPSKQPNVTNNGALIANGGQVLVTAAAAAGTLDNTINMNGVAVAHSVGTQTGDIVIDGGSNGGVVNVAANLDASGKQSGQTGGNVQISGNDILVDSSSVIDVSGDAGGGHISIGANPISNATVIEPGATLLAQALTSGKGGLVETSGQYLEVNGITVNTSAPNGLTGTWLLDPTDITITNLQPTTGSFSNPYTGDDSLTNSYLNTTDLIDALNLSNVVVKTDDLGSGGGSGSIIVASPVTGWTSGDTLTLSAYDNITLNATLGTTSSNATVNLIADNTGTGTGTVTENSAIQNNGQVNIYYNPSTFGTPSSFTNGSGPLTAYMLINTPAELDTLSNNSGLWADNFALGTNINAGTLTATIGNSTTAFSGNFDGQNYSLSNLTINLPSTDDVGLFGDNTGTIQNLNISSGSITGDDDVGAMVGSNSGYLINVSSAADVTGTSIVGGLVGYNALDLTSASSSGTVSGNNIVGGLIGENIYNLDGGPNVAEDTLLSTSPLVATGSNPDAFGGLIGESFSSIANLLHASNISVPTANDVGGIVGIDNNNISYAINTGNVTGQNNVGGIEGTSVDGFNDAYNTGTISGVDNVGGLSGNAESTSTIGDSFNSGAVNGTENVGGIAGYNDGTISTVYNTGSITATSSYGGGLAGENDISGTISNSYNIGAVLGSANFEGGIAGLNNGLITNVIEDGYITDDSFGSASIGANNTSGTISNSFYDLNVSQYGPSFFETPGTVTNVVGGQYGPATGPGTGPDLTQASTYSSADGWDFTNTWGIVNGSSYPYLLFAYPTTPQVIEGTTGLNSSDFLSPTGATLGIAVNGSAYDSVVLGRAGSYYFFEGANALTGVDTTIPSGSLLLLYMKGGTFADEGDAVFYLPAGTSSYTDTVIFPSHVLVGQNDDTSTYSNAILESAASGVSSDSGVLYSFSGNNMTLNSGVSLQTDSTYDFDGNITTSGATGGIFIVGGAESNFITAADPVLTSADDVDFVVPELNGNGNALTVDTSGTGEFQFLNGNGIYDLSALNLTGPGTVTISSNNNYSGPTNIEDGTLEVSYPEPVTPIPDTSDVTVASGATLDIIDSDTIGSLAGAGAVSIATGMNLATADSTSAAYSGDMTGGGSFTMGGTGTQIFSGDNGYSGGTTINSGILNIQNTNGLGTGAVTVNSPGSLVIDGVTTANGVPITLNGTTLEGIGNSGVGNGAITLTGGTDVIESATTGDTFTVNGSIDDLSSGTDSLNIDGPGIVNLASTVGSNEPLDSIDASGPLELSGSTISTTKDQNYTGSLTLGNNITLNALGLSLDGITGAFSLTTNSSNSEVASFDGDIDIGSLTVNGESQFFGAMVETTGAGGQIYNATVAYVNPVQLISGSGPITFNDDFSGTTVTLQNNSAASTGTIMFNGNIISVGQLLTFDEPYAIDINNSTFTPADTFTGAQTFLNTGGVSLGNSAASTIDFDGGLNTSGTEVTTTIDSVLTDAGTNAGFVLGTTKIGGALVDIDSSNNPVSLGTTDSTGSDTNGLVINAGSGAVTLTGAIGSTAPLNTFEINSTDAGTLTLPDSISTGGANNELFLTYGGPVSQTGGVLSTANLNINSVGGISLGDDNVVSEFGADNTTSGNVSLTDTAALSISGITTPGNVTLDNTNSTIAETAPISGALLTTTSTGGTTLTDNNAVTSFKATNTGSGNISLDNTTATLALTGISQSGTGTVGITNNGAMTTSGDLSSASGAIDLTTLGNGSAAENLTINNDITTTSGAIDLDAANVTAGTDTPLTINSGVVLSTGTGSGGILTFEGGTNNQGSFVVGAGDITLNGNGLDIIEGSAPAFTSSVSFLAPRFVIIDGDLSSGVGDNIVLQGDTTDSVAGGGVYVESGDSVISGGTLTIEGVTLANNTPVGADPNAGIDLAGSVSATGSLTISEPSGNGNIDVNGGASGDGVSITPAGTGVINLGGNVTSTGGAIQFNGPVDINAALAVDAGDGAITFGNTVNGNNVLTLQGTPSDGTVTFDNDVTIAGLDTSTSSNQPYAIIFDGSSNTFTDNVTFQNTGGVTLGNGGLFNFEGGLSNVLGTTTLDGTISASGQAISLGTVNLTGDSDFGLSTSVTINDALNGGYNLTILGPSSISFDGLVGNTAPLLSISDHASSTTFADNVTTSGTQTYFNPVNITGNVTFDSTGGNVQMHAVTGTGTQNLDIDAAGADSSVGVISDIVNFTKDGAGTLTLNGQNTYTGTTTLNAGTLALGVTDALPTDTDLNIPANTTFNLGAFGQSLDSLTGTGDVVTGGGSYLELDNTTPVSFGGNISGGGEFIQDGTGTTTFTGDNSYTGFTFIDSGELSIAGAQALSPSTSVEISGNAVLNIDGVDETNTPGIYVDNGSITGTGTASLTSPISFQDGSADALSATAGSTFTVNGDINGAINLTLSGIGSTLDINGNVGNTDPLTSLTTDGTTVSVSGDVATTGNQTYNAPVALTNDVTYDTTSGGNIDFANTLNGEHNLVLTTSGLVTFADAVGGGGAPLDSLTVSGSNIDINGGSIITSGGQTYNDPVTLAIATTLTGTTMNLNHGINGATNFNLNGDTMSIAGPLGLDIVTITGQGANNSFALNSSAVQDWAINSAGAGSITSVTGVGGPFTFSNLQSLIGGAGSDNFSLAGGGSLTGGINGGGGTNSLTGGNGTSTWSITGSNAGTVTGLGTGFSNIQNLTGGSSSNMFTIAGGSLSGTLNGGTSGDNTLVGGNRAETWTITGNDTGRVTSVSSFNNIQNLTGGNAGNTFNFANGAMITGMLNGGSLNATNEINWSANSGTVTDTLTSNIYDGTAYVAGNAITNYTNVNSIVGNDGLLSISKAQLADLTRTGPFSGTIADPLMFSGFFVPGAAPTAPSSFLPVYPIIQQPDSSYSTPVDLYGLNYDVDNNISDNEDIVDYVYKQALQNVHINPYCGLGGGGNL